MSKQIFNDKELDALLSSAILGGATDEECQKLIEWATLIKISSAVLDVVLTGKTIIAVRENGEPIHKVFRT